MPELTKDDFVSLSLAVLAQGYITPRLPELPDGDLISILNDPTTQSFLVLGIVFIILRESINKIRTFLSKSEEASSPVGVITADNPPSNVLYGAVIRYGDVDWQTAHGTTRGNEVTYVEGPYCPRCGTELSRKVNRRRIRPDQKKWKCSSCGYSTSRETDTKDSQKEVVEKIVANEADDSMKNIHIQDDDEIQDLNEKIFEKATDIEPKVEDFVKNPTSENHDDDVREAIVEGIERVVDEGRIRNEPKVRIALKEGFDYTLPEDNREYEILDEDVNENKVRRFSQNAF